jgi:hypothetical protein
MNPTLLPPELPRHFYIQSINHKKTPKTTWEGLEPSSVPTSWDGYESDALTPDPSGEAATPRLVIRYQLLINRERFTINPISF